MGPAGLEAPSAVPNSGGAAGALLLAAEARTRAFRDAILESGPAHYWPLDETEGEGGRQRHRYRGRGPHPEEIAAHAALLFARVVQIDIRPGSDANAIHSGSRGTVPVAVLGEADFDATTVDPLSVQLVGAAVRTRNGRSHTAAEDANGDGLMDLVVHVETA